MRRPMRKLARAAAALAAFTVTYGLAYWAGSAVRLALGPPREPAYGLLLVALMSEVVSLAPARTVWRLGWWTATAITRSASRVARGTAQ